ncbi:MAG TPA: hypothetical protein VEB41_03240, partial [Burkholderiales bacterium]|nr:hypothetical protein [Burkholderiales bacterium]
MKRLLERFGISRERAGRFGLPVLALVLVASVVTGREKPSVVETPPVARLAQAPVSDADLDLEKMRRERAEEKVVAAADP